MELDEDGSGQALVLIKRPLQKLETHKTSRCWQAGEYLDVFVARCFFSIIETTLFVGLLLFNPVCQIHYIYQYA